MKYCNLIILFLFVSIAKAQEIKPKIEEPPNFDKEVYGGINFNTNGGLIGGLSFNFAHNYKEKKFNLFTLEIVQVKHFKSLKVSSLLTGNSFILGKFNYLSVIRPQYGHEWQLFEKGPQDGSRLNFVVAGGPSFGLLTPYYYSVEDFAGNSRDIRIEELILSGDYQILSSSGFFKGFNETTLQMGANLKLALNFEFGTYKSSISGIEVGWTLEYFSNPPKILVNEVQPQLFNALSLTLMYGSRH